MKQLQSPGPDDMVTFGVLQVGLKASEARIIDQITELLTDFMDRIDERFDQLERRLDRLEKRVDAHDGRLDHHDYRLGKLEAG